MVIADEVGLGKTFLAGVTTTYLDHSVSTRYIVHVEVAASARRHGIADEDIRHAVRIPFRRVVQGADRMLIIGPDRSGRLLEVVVLDPEGDPVAIHAMELRRKFYDYL